MHYIYTTDIYGNLTQYTENKSGTTVLTQTISYDGKAQLSKVVYSGQVTRTDAYTYNGTYIDYVTKITTGNFTIMPKQDVDERYTGKTVAVNGTTVDAETLTYVKQGDHATRMPKQITYPDTHISYTYDGNGNIIRIMQGGVLQAKYSYDTLGRLIREDNKALDTSYFYTYDNNGNITARESCSFTTDSHTKFTGTVTSYTYDKDKLTKFGIESCTYDDVGNPTIYRGKTARWTRGRKLISYNGNAFSYDAQGRRIKKNSITYTYDSNGRLLKQSNGLEFFYDTTGLVGLTYNGMAYVYRKDIQGNIIAILDSTGAIVVQYKYNAWGYHTISGSNPTLGNLNPFRYRSYYFDTETKLYFLQSRYYDPVVGRFLNMDSLEYADPETINGLNLYAYCNNNPVMGYDPEGTFVSTILGGIFGAIWGGISSALQGKDVWKGMLVGAATGALAGFFVDAAVATGGVGGILVAAAGGFIAGFAGDIANQMIVDGRTWDEVNPDQAITVGVVTAITNVLGYGISYAVSGLGNAVPKSLNLFQQLFASLSPSVTPLGSWIGQAVLGFGIASFSSLLGFVK